MASMNIARRPGRIGGIGGAAGSGYTNPTTGQHQTYGQTGADGSMGYAPDAPVNRAMPGMYQDPNSKNVMQWDPIKGQFSTFSTGAAGSARAFGDLDQLMARFGNTGSDMSGSGSLTPGSSPHVSLDQGAIDAGDAAAFSRAKDTVGRNTAASLKSLTNQFAGRGLRGSSIEGGEIGRAVGAGAGQLDDVARSQAVAGSDRAVDLAKTAYQGDVTQRGQDIGANTAYAQIASTQQANKFASLLGLIKSAGSLY